MEFREDMMYDIEEYKKHSQKKSILDMLQPLQTTKIELTDYLHTCENDCCMDYGTEVHIEGKYIADVPANSPESLLEIVLKHFGIEATVSRSYEEGESGCYETPCKLDKEEDI